MIKRQIINRVFFELSGSIHNHTEYSKDGRVPVKDLIQYAEKSDLDFFTINDHNTLEAKNDPALKKSSKVILIIGLEVNDPDDNHHLLVFNTDQIITETDAQTYVDFYKDSHAITFAAHPNERRISQQFRKYEWLDRSLNKFDGLEIWNYSSSWLGKVKPSLNGLICVFFPQLFIRKPLRKNLNFWDSLNLANLRKSAIGSVDAHDIVKKVCFCNIHILPHRKLFKTIRTNVLLRDNQEINDQNILNALKKGNSYIVNYSLGKPWNFYAVISDQEGHSATFGEEIHLSPTLRFYFNLPIESTVVLYFNGKKTDIKKDKKGFFKVNEPGFYRLEISRFRYGWIYTNPIYVLPYENE